MTYDTHPISSFCKTSSGGTPSRSKPEYYNGSIPWVKSGELREEIVNATSEHVTEMAIKESSAKMIPAGALLVAMYGATIGRVAYLGMPAATNQAVCNIIPDETKAYRQYLFYALRSKAREWISRGAGGAQPNISQKIIQETKIPLPPLEEQKRIAAILDKADAIRKKRQQAIELTEQFLRSTFLDMFGDPITNPKGWKITSLGDVTNRVTKGESPKWQGFDYQEAGVRFVTSENVLMGTLDCSKDKFIPVEFHKKLIRSELRSDDLLINLVGASVGRSSLMASEYLPANINQAVAVVSVDSNQLVPQFLLHLVITSQMQKLLLGNVVDAARANISLTNIRDLEIILPPLEVQNEWNRIKRKALHSCAKLKTSNNHSNDLFNSLVQYAFRGEL